MPIRNSTDASPSFVEAKSAAPDKTTPGAAFDARGYSHGNRPDTWLKPGLSERLAELHRLNQSSFLEIAETLSAEFNIKVSRNAVIGRAKRMHLPDRAQTRLPAKYETLQLPIKVSPVKVPVKQPAPRVSKIPGKSRNLSIYELHNGCCRWPYGDKAPFKFCGRATPIGSSWCPQHAARAYVRSRGGWA